MKSEQKSERIDVTEEVRSLVKKAAEAEDSSDALKFSQAACNSANAMACLHNIPKSGE